MNHFITRHAIYDKRRQAQAYELVYRVVRTPQDGPGEDSEQLIADAITVYGLPNLANSKPAYVPCSARFIMDDTIQQANPAEMVIEMEEDIQVTEELIGRLRTLKAHGYKLALNTFSGRASAAPLIPLLNVLKIDFRQTDPQLQESFTIWAKRSKQLTLLAENIENREEFERASKLGYELFQGEFFSNAGAMDHPAPMLMTSTHLQILSELNLKEDADYNKISKFIHADASLTYQLMQRIQTVKYHRMNSITAISQALIMMGIDEVRRWILLLLAHEHNVAESDELIRTAFLRGTFCRMLTEAGAKDCDSEEAFILGMFSMLDKIMGKSLPELLESVHMVEEVEAALLGTEDNFYAQLLRFVGRYEDGTSELDPSDIGLHKTGEELARIYLNSIIETDQTFTVMGDKT